MMSLIMKQYTVHLIAQAPCFLVNCPNASVISPVHVYIIDRTKLFLFAISIHNYPYFFEVSLPGPWICPSVPPSSLLAEKQKISRLLTGRVILFGIRDEKI